MTQETENEAIRTILLRIRDRIKAVGEPAGLAETVILTAGEPRTGGETAPPRDPSEKDAELITETIFLSPKRGVGNSSVPSPGIPAENQGMVETVIVSGDRWEGNLSKKAAAKPVEEDFLAETMILEEGRKTGKDGREQ